MQWPLHKLSCDTLQTPGWLSFSVSALSMGCPSSRSRTAFTSSTICMEICGTYTSSSTVTKDIHGRAQTPSKVQHLERLDYDVKPSLR